MRIVIHLNDYDDSPESIEHNAHTVANPPTAGDDRAVIDGVYVEWFPGGGNIHVTDSRITDISELMDGSVNITRDDGEQYTVENAGIVGVYPGDD